MSEEILSPITPEPLALWDQILPKLSTKINNNISNRSVYTKEELDTLTNETNKILKSLDILIYNNKVLLKKYLDNQ